MLHAASLAAGRMLFVRCQQLKLEPQIYGWELTKDVPISAKNTTESSRRSVKALGRLRDGGGAPRPNI